MSMEKFELEVLRGTQIKGYLLENWANKLKIDLDLNVDKPLSKSYLDKFKCRNRIFSRKVNKFFSKR